MAGEPAASAGHGYGQRGELMMLPIGPITRLRNASPMWCVSDEADPNETDAAVMQRLFDLVSELAVASLAAGVTLIAAVLTTCAHDHRLAAMLQAMRSTLEAAQAEIAR